MLVGVQGPGDAGLGSTAITMESVRLEVGLLANGLLPLYMSILGCPKQVCEVVACKSL